MNEPPEKVLCRLDILTARAWSDKVFLAFSNRSCPDDDSKLEVGAYSSRKFERESRKARSNGFRWSVECAMKKEVVDEETEEVKSVREHSLSTTRIDNDHAALALNDHHRSYRLSSTPQKLVNTMSIAVEGPSGHDIQSAPIQIQAKADSR